MQLSPIIASQSRAICTEAQNYQNCDLVKNMGKMPKMAKTMSHYSSFGLTKRPKKFETILGTSSFFSVVSHGITPMQHISWLHLFISAVTNPILTKIFVPNFWGASIFEDKKCWTKLF